MTWPYRNHVLAYNSSCAIARGHYADAEANLTEAWVWWGIGDFLGWQYWIILAFESHLAGSRELLDEGGRGVEYQHLLQALLYSWEWNTEKLPEVTWQSIIEAWIKDDFEGRAWTIGVIDRMRQIVWDEPFDLTWAARPEKREIDL